MQESGADVTLNQYRALVVLASRSPIRMSDLADELSLAPSSATRLVERLERKGLVVRAMSETSRRAIDLRLEPAGEQLVARVMAERRRQFEDLLAGVSDRRKATMRRAFEDLARLSGEPVGEASPALLGRLDEARSKRRSDR